MGSQFDSSDVQALVTICQAVSEEIILDRVIDRFLMGAVECAGATRGLLLLCDTGVRIVSEVVNRDGEVLRVQRPFGSIELELLPAAALHYVRRTFRPVILGDAPEAAQQETDAFFSVGASRSVLCLPLLKRGRLLGMLCLENELTSQITSDQLSFLRVLASQAAISIENAAHFHDVQQHRDQARGLEAELRRYFDNLPVIAWQYSADGSLDFTNKRWHDYTGSSPDDDPLDVWSYFHPDDREQVAERWRYMLEFRTSGEIEARMRRSDGQYRRFLCRGAPLLDESGAIVKWHGINTDIEDIKRAEEAQNALARVSRVTAMGELTVSIAHEINQPLMAIVTNAASCLRWLASESVNVAEARLAAERIVRDGHRAGEVIASIRAMARKAPVQFVEIDFNEVIGEVLILARNELQRHGIIAEARLTTEACQALGDRVQIQQVVLNLVMNGIESMLTSDPGSRRLVVRSENLESGFVQASILDSGHGLDAKDTDQIFDAFFTTKTDGLGMGLSICRSIVENHGGRIAVSPNMPRGCIFSVQLPMAGQQPTAG